MLEYANLDHGFLSEVLRRAGGERAAACFQCGTCTAGCPVSAVRAGYNPRRIMRWVLMGLRDEALGSPELWQCSQCHVCVAHCPQDARCADVIRALREMAVEGGYAPASRLEEVERIDEALRRRRVELIEALTGRQP